MDHDCTKDNHSCCNLTSTSGVQQSLDEMEFERGIWYAAQHNDSDKVQNLLKKGTSPNILDSAGYTALHYASRNNHYEICMILLENGAEVNAVTRSGQATALHRASAQGHKNIVQLLLDHGANPNLQDADGFTALHRALTANIFDVCKVLVLCTNLSLKDSHGRTPEILAKEVYPDALTLFIQQET